MELVAVRGVLIVQVLENDLDVGDLLVAQPEGLLRVGEMSEHHHAAELGAGAAVHAHAAGVHVLRERERNGQPDHEKGCRAEDD